MQSQFFELFGECKIWISLEKICLNGPQNGFYRKGADVLPNTRIVKMKELFAYESMDMAETFDYVNMTEIERKRFALTSDDLLFGRRSLVIEGAGKCRRVGNIQSLLTFESSLLRITLDSKRVIPRYVQGWFDTEEGKKAITAIRATTTISGIKGSDLKKIKVPLPPLSLQEQFAAFARQSDKSKFDVDLLVSNQNYLLKSL